MPVKTAVIGHPVSHSKSPLIHNYWIKKYGLKGEYGALDVRPENIEAALKQCVQEDYTGLNLTLPHKELALEFCNEVDEIAKTVGVVNTLVLREGKIIGFNTDVFGFVENIRESAGGFDFAKGPAIVLGAGGAAQAIVYSLLQEGAPEITVLNRTEEKARALAAKFKNVKVLPWDKRSQILKDANLLVNTTSLGMQGQSPLEIDLKDLHPKALVNDIVYVPLETDLLKQAEKRGNPRVTGIGMLLHQARPAFEKWFGVLPRIDPELLKLVLR